MCSWFHHVDCHSFSLLFLHVNVYFAIPDKLKDLIDAAIFEEITFVYAISPGLDITFSSAADTAALKKKMKQV